MFSITKYFFLFILCLAFLNDAVGQKKSLIDSLINDLEQTTSKKKEVDIYNELAWYTNNSDLNISLSYANEGLQLAKLIQYPRGEATSHIRMALVLRNQTQLDSALFHYNRAYIIEKKLNNEYGIGRAKNGMGIVYKNQKHFYKAIPLFKEALKSFQNLNKLTATYQVINNLGNCYFELGDYQKAIQLYLEILETYKQNENTQKLADITLDLSRFYLKVKNYHNAIKYGEESLFLAKKINSNFHIVRNLLNVGIAYYELSDFGKAKVYYAEGVKLSKKLNLKNYERLYYHDLGNLYRKKGDLKQANQYFEKCLTLQPDIDIKGRVYHNQGIIFQSLGQNDKAENLFQKSLQMSKKLNNSLLSMNILKDLSALYSSQNKYSLATKYNQEYIYISDSMYTSLQTALNYKDALEEEQFQKKLLEKNQEVQQNQILRYKAESVQQTTFIYALTSGVLFLITVYILSLRSYKHKKQKLLTHNKLILQEKEMRVKQQEVEVLLKTQEIKTFAAMLEGEEKERKRIAQDLHDGVGSKLSMVKLHFAALNTELDTIQLKDVSKYTTAYQLLDEACDDIRSVSHNLISGTLLKFGLLAAIQDLKQSIEASNLIEVELIEVGLENIRLDTKVEVTVYRIIQEIISNTLRHAEATELSLQLYKKENLLHIMTEDNGKGFDESNSSYKSGIGMKNINTRVYSLRGDLVIDTSVGRGTIFIIDIPLN